MKHLGLLIFHPGAVEIR